MKEESEEDSEEESEEGIREEKGRIGRLNLPLEILGISLNLNSFGSETAISTKCQEQCGGIPRNADARQLDLAELAHFMARLDITQNALVGKRYITPVLSLSVLCWMHCCGSRALWKPTDP